MDSILRKVVVFGLVVLSFLAPLKFNVPAVLPHLNWWPSNSWEWLIGSWPVSLFYFVLALLAVLMLGAGERWGTPRRIWLWPVLFLTTQLISAVFSIDRSLSFSVLCLWLALAGGYWLGAKAIRDTEDLKMVLFAWVAASGVVAWTGYGQANGGLEEPRLFLAAHPEWARNQPELWRKIQSNRIFSTFVNPNALGGYIASAVFVIAAWGFQIRKKWWRFISIWVAAIAGMALLYCLWKSQSKGAYAAFFLALASGMIAWAGRFSRRMVIALSLCAVLALAGFAAGYGILAVEKGKKTWNARMGYWQAAVRIGAEHPVLGTGPGTFLKLYSQYKASEDESTKLVHNNYLQMWCDSGLLGFLAFLLWLPRSLWVWWSRRNHLMADQKAIQTLVWCACMAFAIHSLVDFNLYLPGNAWPVFVLLGFLARAEPLSPSGQVIEAPPVKGT